MSTINLCFSRIQTLLMIDIPHKYKIVTYITYYFFKKSDKIVKLRWLYWYSRNAALQTPPGPEGNNGSKCLECRDGACKAATN